MILAMRTKRVALSRNDTGRPSGLDSPELTCPVRSDRHNVHQVAEAVKVVGVAGVKPGRMSVGGRRYQQVHVFLAQIAERIGGLLDGDQGQP